METKLKLFIWHDVFCDYTDGIAFAIAEDSEQARDLIVAGMGDGSHLREQLGGKPEVRELNEPYGFGIWGGG